MLESFLVEMHTISTVENPAAAAASRLNGISDLDENSKDRWSYEELDQMAELAEPTELDDHLTDGSEYEDSYSKRNKKKGKGKGSKVI